MTHQNSKKALKRAVIDRNNLLYLLITKYPHISLFLLLWLSLMQGRAQAPYTMEQLLCAPFPSALCSAANSPVIAWTERENGARNIVIASAPAFRPEKITRFTAGDEQEISQLQLSGNGEWIVFVRGGDHGGGWDETSPVNVNSLPQSPRTAVWTINLSTKESHIIGDGDAPVISFSGDKVLFLQKGKPWIASSDGRKPATLLFSDKGNCTALEWSPDEKKIAFVSDRKDHALIGIYTDSLTPIQWVAPSFANDESPKWSDDGRQIVFVRRPGSEDKHPDSLLRPHLHPWSLWTADIQKGEAHQIWQSPPVLRANYPTTSGGVNLHWLPGNKILYLSYEDGWPHLYTISTKGGKPTLLTPGNFHIEQIALSADNKWIYFSANTGRDSLDIDRRHICRVAVDKPGIELLSQGSGIETYPMPIAGQSAIALLSATPTRPLLPAILSQANARPALLEKLPASFPEKEMVTPTQVIFTAPDGTRIHAQLFMPAQKKKGKIPAVVFAHGGPQRQMVLGWHYSGYYANCYAVNQYLAANGFAVLSINYRSGIGYGYAFNKPLNAYNLGASEYPDIRAGGEWLASQPFIDSSRIGIYGGSYGGWLTGLALSMDSRLFKAGVDIHGVHNHDKDETVYNSMEAPDIDTAIIMEKKSFPVGHLDTWKSPVLLIHGDDDRNVDFHQTMDLIPRLERYKIPFESILIPDDTHHWIKFENELRVDKATVEFLQRKLKQ